MKSTRGSSVPAKQAAKSGKRTRRRQLDFSDIPELSVEQLATMRRVGRPSQGGLPRQLISIRIDQRVLAWVRQTAKRQDKPYQSLINDILQREMQRAR